MADQESKQSETAASGGTPRLEDRVRKVGQAFEGLTMSEVGDVFVRGYEAARKEAPGILTDIQGFFKALVVPEDPRAQSFITQLHELCDKRRWSKPTFLLKRPDAHGPYLATVATLIVWGESTHSVSSDTVQGFDEKAARELASKSLLEKLSIF